MTRSFYMSWLLQLFGFGCSFWCSSAFTCWYFFGMVMSVAYSHPSIRMKGNPIGSTVIVSFMQGFGAYCAGWIAAGVPVIGMTNLKGLLGAIGIQFMTAGMYPLTQIYQAEEDRKHGDQTLALALGISGSFAFSMFCIGTAGACLCCMISLFYSWWQGIGIGLYMAALVFFVHSWKVTFNPQDVKANFKMLHSLSYLNSLLFSAFTLGHLAGIL